MSDWELVEISAREPESSSEESAESDQGGLSTGVETLHSSFGKMRHIYQKLKIDICKF